MKFGKSDIHKNKYYNIKFYNKKFLGVSSRMVISKEPK